MDTAGRAEAGATAGPRIVGEGVFLRSLPVRDWPEVVAVPDHLRRAVPSRVRAHLAGRACAVDALRDAGCPDGRAIVGVGPRGAPAWPRGFVGSITHGRAFAAAAVATGERLRGIGIDSEEVLDAAALAEVAPLVAGDAEARWLAGERRLERATLLFSAKESLYKCLAPIAGVFFDFADARIEDVDDVGGTWRARLLVDLPGFARDSVFAGRFAVAGGVVHTALELGI